MDLYTILLGLPNGSMGYYGFLNDVMYESSMMSWSRSMMSFYDVVVLDRYDVLHMSPTCLSYLIFHDGLSV